MCQVLEKPLFYEVIEKEKFDLVIVDIFINYCVLGIIPMLKAPSIFVTTMSAPSSLSTVFGNRLPPSFVPNTLFKYTDRMSFSERFINTVFDSLLAFMTGPLFLTKSENLYKQYLPNGNLLPGIDEIHDNSSMLFMNSHFTLNYPRPLLPDVIEVGGMHTRPPKKLPKDLDDFLSNSGKDGFIFFSLGSIVKAKNMPENYRKVFLNVFSGHPNVRLFMTHGGLLSTQESVYHGVPVLGLPLFGMKSYAQAERGGYAKMVEILDITEEKLESAILELLKTQCNYAQKAKELSKLVKDLPQTPLEKAVYWAEYVLRHKGAPHLRSAARDLIFPTHMW
ncbi:2-hydroxyacylsphingosine 1-beta-galactosyltransferase [Orchesella cincta]|uniref:2-hydroxyacylsphingosine 1-beta-galactosyltransferase n=1 Tax=Orchesella cincta TaxID=48709 RepID=A0A1D2MBA1_ORCCI|nr:2-hydroxyacylsphingosine 1-beta-galactosyltransferase [Orchesella cincta]